MKSTKKIAMVIAFKGFMDEEYFVPVQIFNDAGFEVVTVSTSLGTAFASYGGEAEVDILIENLNVKDFDAVVFVGGNGSVKHLSDEKFHNVAKETIKNRKLLAGICFAPSILAKAGVLVGKKATVWSRFMDKTTIKILKENGAGYVESNVVSDGNIITANGPEAAEEFAKEIIKKLSA